MGNRIEKGAPIHWYIPEDTAKRNVFRVLDVSDGGLSVVGPGGETRSPATITLVITLPIRGVAKGQEPILADFVVLLDPSSQSLAERMLADGPLVSPKKPQ